MEWLHWRCANSSNVRYNGTSSTEWDNYLYDGVSKWDIPIISHVTGISRVLIGTNNGVAISGDLGFTGGTSGDITFNNSLQSGVQKYSSNELVCSSRNRIFKTFICKYFWWCKLD